MLGEPAFPEIVEHDFLTMTDLYNVVERLRELESGYDVPPLDEKEKRIHEAGLVSVLKEVHDEIDTVVFEAYSWTDLAPALVGKPGGTIPSPYKTAEQEAAEAELLTRLVALNRERAEEERQGVVRWLRPDYQRPRLEHKVAKPKEPAQIEAALVSTKVDGRPKWPSDGLQQIRLVRDVLAKSGDPAAADAVAAAFAGSNSPKRKKRVAEVLATLAATGAARVGVMPGEEAPHYFIPR